jgi:hypothetical protein
MLGDRPALLARGGTCSHERDQQYDTPEYDTPAGDAMHGGLQGQGSRTARA